MLHVFDLLEIIISLSLGPEQTCRKLGSLTILQKAMLSMGAAMFVVVIKTLPHCTSYTQHTQDLMTYFTSGCQNVFNSRTERR